MKQPTAFCPHQSGAEFNNAVCELRCGTGKSRCADYNRNLMLAECDDRGLPLLVLEQPCPRRWPAEHPYGCGRSYNEEQYDDRVDIIRCKECPEAWQCRRVLSPKIVTSPLVDKQGRYTLNYSEFSGCTTVIAPNTLTFDIRQNNPEAQTLHPVQTIQFLLWDNRGCDKREACDVAIRYRLLVSDFEGDLICNEAGELVPADGGTVRWRVLYDTLRESYNGWQVFHLDRPLAIRYIRLHFISSSDECRRCNIVRLGAYSKRLVGYPYYNYLPTLERRIILPTDDGAEQIEETRPKAGAKRSRTSADDDSIVKFPRALLEQIRLHEQQKRSELNRTSYPALEKIQIRLLADFAKDLEIVIKDLHQHDKHVARVKSDIFRNISRSLRNADLIKGWSIAMTVIGLLIALYELLPLFGR